MKQETSSYGIFYVIHIKHFLNSLYMDYGSTIKFKHEFWFWNLEYNVYCMISIWWKQPSYNTNSNMDFIGLYINAEILTWFAIILLLFMSCIFLLYLVYNICPTECSQLCLLNRNVFISIQNSVFMLFYFSYLFFFSSFSFFVLPIHILLQGKWFLIKTSRQIPYTISTVCCSKSDLLEQ